MLVFVHFQSFLIAAHTHEWLDIDIVIHSIHIGIGMVNDIVFVMPDKAVSAQNAKRQCGHLVDHFTFAETSVTSVMHNIESNR